MKVKAIAATYEAETTSIKNIYKKIQVTVVHAELTVAYLFNGYENSPRCAGIANLR